MAGFVARVPDGAAVGGGERGDQIAVPRNRHRPPGEPFVEPADPPAGPFGIDTGNPRIPAGECTRRVEPQAALVVEMDDRLAVIVQFETVAASAVGAPCPRSRGVDAVGHERDRRTVVDAHDDPLDRRARACVEGRRPSLPEHPITVGDDRVVGAHDVERASDRRERQVGVLVDHVAVGGADGVVDEARRLRDAHDRHGVEHDGSRRSTNTLGSQRRRQRGIGDGDRSAVVVVGSQQFIVHRLDEELVLPHVVEEGGERRQSGDVHVALACGDRARRQAGDRGLGGLGAPARRLHPIDEGFELGGVGGRRGHGISTS